MSQTKPMNSLTAIVHLTQLAEHLEENDFSNASQDRAVCRAVAALREMVITDREVHWTAYPKHTDWKVETHPLDRARVMEAAQAAQAAEATK
jgi:hypothetical protein